MKIKITFLLSYWTISIGVAQNFFKSSPFTDYSTPDLAYAAFQKAINGKTQDKILANYGLAQYWYTKDSFTLAYQHAQNVMHLFLSAKDKHKNALQKKGITPSSARLIMDALCTAAFRKIQSSESWQDWEGFLNTYPKPPYRTKDSWRWDTAFQRRNACVCKQLSKTEDLEELNQMLAHYEKDLHKTHFDCLQTGYFRHFKLFFEQNPWTELGNYFAFNPKNPLGREAARMSFQEAVMSQDLARMQLFLQLYPTSVFAPILQDSIFYRTYPHTGQKEDIHILIKMLKRHPNAPFAAALDSTLSRYLAETGFVTPFLQMNLSGTPKLAEKLYDIYFKYGEIGALKQFLKDYQEIPFQKTVEEDIALLQNVAKNKDEAAFLKRFAASKTGFGVLQQRIQSAATAKDWNKVLEILLSYETYFKKDKRYVELLEVVRRPLSNAAKHSLTAEVNSPHPEYCPVMTADDKTLYFCRKNENEDIFVSQRKGENEWERALVAQGLATKDNEAPLAISADGQRLLIFSNGRLYESEKTMQGGWTALNSISPNINEYNWQGEATLSADSKVIIFEAAHRPSTVGLNQYQGAKADFRNIDLFISFRAADGTWSKGVNLGQLLNTPFMERSPFLHPDMKTLYFCSEGRGGMGGLDLYKTTRLDDTWLKWSEPVHIGKEINTPQDDWGYKVSTNGRFGYFSSGGDIWLVTPLPRSAAPLPMRVITGKLLSSDSKPIHKAKILVRNRRGELVSTLNVDPVTGEYAIVLPEGVDYEGTITDEGNVYTPLKLDLNTMYRGLAERQDNIVLISESELDKGTFTFQNLNFDSGKYELKQEALPELNRWADLIIRYNLKVTIEGHTDNVGSMQDNLLLSRNRAKAAREYLIQRGCKAAQITAEGFGATRPVGNNLSETSRFQNRRVVLHISRI